MTSPFKFHRPAALRRQRIDTLRRQLFSLVSIVLLFAIALYGLAQVMDTANIYWFIGLFAAAFGLGARQVVADFVTGISFMFDDPFDVGEKIEFTGLYTVEGIVEHVDLRKTIVRAATGERYVVPNSEIRAVRNFSRGNSSDASIVVNVSAADLTATLTVFEQAVGDLASEFPNLLEPIRIVCEDGTLGQVVQLKVIAIAQFGTAAPMKPRLMAAVQSRLHSAGIDVA